MPLTHHCRVRHPAVVSSRTRHADETGHDDMRLRVLVDGLLRVNRLAKANPRSTSSVNVNHIQ
jgi:hypothetical protein